ncbi:nuclear protein [Ascosphaera atra]|nr:nuclear protein [Ascosphaera atra]
MDEPREPNRDAGRATKRRRNEASQSQAAHQRVLQEHNDSQFYDPDQSAETRRQVRKEYRELAQDLTDSRAEFILPSSNRLDLAVERANELFNNVKQTAEAVIDSRFLVNAADLSLKRTMQAVLGDSTASIDVDEFVSKCITFMRQSPLDNDRPMNTQNRRPYLSQVDAENDEDPLNWDWLGRQACFPNNMRPAVSGFLLGPLSVRKRTRMFTQRRARERIDSSKAVRPQELRQEDLEKQETSDLTTMCAEVREILVQKQQENEQKATAELEQLPPDASEVEQLSIMYKHGISDDGGVPLFKFCINPESFGQTVENLFYISFLVRDGTVGLSMDSNDLPTLIPSEPEHLGEAKRRGIQKHQAVLAIDFPTWRELIKVFDIKESMIPHRSDEQQGQRTATWYS